MKNASKLQLAGLKFKSNEDHKDAQDKAIASTNNNTFDHVASMGKSTGVESNSQFSWGNSCRKTPK